MITLPGHKPTPVIGFQVLTSWNRAAYEKRMHQRESIRTASDVRAVRRNADVVHWRLTATALFSLWPSGGTTLQIANEQD